MNKSGDWRYENISWKLPNEGQSGALKDANSDQILRFLPNKSQEHFEVILQLPDNDAFGQKWQRSEANKEGWFTLMCKENQEFLTAASSDLLIVSGN